MLRNTSWLFYAFACVFYTMHRIMDRLMQIQNTHIFIWQNEKYAFPFTFNPIMVVVCSEANNLVCSSNTGILGSSPHRNTNILTCSFLSVFFLWFADCASQYNLSNWPNQCTNSCFIISLLYSSTCFEHFWSITKILCVCVCVCYTKISLLEVINLYKTEGPATNFRPDRDRQQISIFGKARRFNMLFNKAIKIVVYYKRLFTGKGNSIYTVV